jgi:CubicO group peptidase (beta-lactamase class C family)
MDATQAATRDARWTGLCDHVTAAMAQLHVPGVALGLIDGGDERTAGFGITNVAHPLAVTADTYFRAESITKTVTATAAMRLVEQGALVLDAPVRVYLPEFRLADESAAAILTLRHLLTHTGGWDGDADIDTGMGDDALARFVPHLADLPQITPPGALFSYNNLGFALAGRVIEVTTGQTYEAAVRALVLNPIGMERSTFFAQDVIGDRVAIGHATGDTGPTPNRVWAAPRASNPQGGLITAATDLLHYARFHIGDGTLEDGTHLLAPETMTLMRSPLIPIGGDVDAVGIAWQLRDLGDIRIAQHGGSRSGQHALITLIPTRDFALIVLTNGENGGRLCREITSAALHVYCGLTPPQRATIAVPPAALDAYIGRYRVRLATVAVARHDGTLGVQVALRGRTLPPAPLVFYADDQAVIRDGPLLGTHVTFLRAPDGRVGWLRIANRVHPRET